VMVIALRRLRHDQQRQFVDMQSEFPFSHRGAVHTDGADDPLGRPRF
jgi:hypothetical protein